MYCLAAPRNGVDELTCMYCGQRFVVSILRNIHEVRDCLKRPDYLKLEEDHVPTGFLNKSCGKCARCKKYFGE